MKKLLILLIIGICGIVLRLPQVASAVGLAAAPASIETDMQHMAVENLQRAPMSAAEYMELSKTDPQAYQKFLNSHAIEPSERTEVDKLMNFFSNGNYE